MKNVPKGWARTTIGEIAELVNGRAFKTSEWTSDGLPIVRIQNLNRQDAPFYRYSGPVAEKHMVRAGDLLFAWSGTPGTSFGAHVWRGPDAVLNQHIFNVRIDNNLADREFLRFLIGKGTLHTVGSSDDHGRNVRVGIGAVDVITVLRYVR